mmetsp:Transcript_9150/g.22439  ORF Transcript_9150/g.22439 Transcript_9150/m.22439 type:complete len:229 (+) Transcript_9150:158-844(+)|eukprot:CAMPEP_0179002230 /NCGR_PEP_ID=MMETSP0795-20121207/11867_1 /TAXON_ID=88552 /ORGANISM="Amoebophrya sp., Strain Ameob2" /LENGTH=228 /DNA_ID=CAMNT_0020695825 /DNA_START=150 /DNA_END=836 /DNA_ORIENTATION=+
MKPANNCCGFFTLLFGVEVICLINLIQAIATVALVSSTEVISIGGVKIPPLTQVLYGAWCLIGIPIVINAGLGAVYRVEGQLRFYFYYLSLQLVLTTAYFIAMLFEGDVCSTVVSVDLQRMGSSMVCGFTDAFAIFWMLINIGFFVYLIYIIWSAAEHVSMSFFPDLVAYKQRLHGQVGQPIAQPVTVKPPAHLMPDIMRSRQQADGLANQAAADFNRISQHVDALGR